MALHERLRFDIDAGQVLDGPRRYVLLRTDVLMGLFDALPDAARRDALRAFGESVMRFGADSVRAYAAEAGAVELLATMQDAAASLGWGRWQFELRDDALALEVRNSPFAAGTARHDAPACHAIAGMLAAVGSALGFEGARSRELSCVAASDSDGSACRFAVPFTPTPTRKESDS